MGGQNGIGLIKNNGGGPEKRLHDKKYDSQYG